MLLIEDLRLLEEVVAFILFTSYILVNKAGLKRKWWVWTLSILAILVAVNMVKERWPL